MEKPFCVGEDECEFLNAKISSAPKRSSSAVALSVPELGNTTLVVQKDDDSMSQWMGVYCPHYQRFYCTGGADGCKTGCCATAADYERSLTDHMEKYK